ncbi:MAG TPA: hypothetical protein VFW28_05620 [Micropepsaceae bacterium]|nr:hypothetical protein [Micropepsaceae bacterium]
MASQTAFVRQAAHLKARSPAVVELPLPALGRAADPGWRQVALDRILSRRVRPFVGPVEVSLTFRDGRARRVIGDLPNACLEVLIASRLIAAADSAVLRRLQLAWGPVGGVRVEIRPFEEGRA